MDLPLAHVAHYYELLFFAPFVLVACFLILRSLVEQRRAKREAASGG